MRGTYSSDGLTIYRTGAKVTALTGVSVTGPRVLIVEDDESIRSLFERVFLSGGGIRVDVRNLPSGQGMLGRGLCGVKALSREAEKQIEGDRRGQTPRSP